MRYSFKICYTLALLLFITFSQAQIESADITYRVKMKSQGNPPNSKFTRMFEFINSMEIKLLHNQARSFFGLVDTFYSDDIALASDQRKAEISVDMHETSYHYDVERKEIIKTTDFEGQIYNIHKKFNDIVWEKHSKTKTINGYTCYKATRTWSYSTWKGGLETVVVAAWYAPDIDLPLGPKNYVGLDGLILELEEKFKSGATRVYYVSKMNINTDEVINIQPYKVGRRVTPVEFELISNKALGKYTERIKDLEKQ